MCDPQLRVPYPLRFCKGWGIELRSTALLHPTNICHLDRSIALLRCAVEKPLYWHLLLPLLFWLSFRAKRGTCFSPVLRPHSPKSRCNGKANCSQNPKRQRRALYQPKATPWVTSHASVEG